MSTTGTEACFDPLLFVVTGTSALREVCRILESKSNVGVEYWALETASVTMIWIGNICYKAHPSLGALEARVVGSGSPHVPEIRELGNVFLWRPSTLDCLRLQDLIQVWKSSHARFQYWGVVKCMIPTKFATAGLGVNNFEQDFQQAIQAREPADIRANLQALFEGATQTLTALINERVCFIIFVVKLRQVTHTRNTAQPVIPNAAEVADNVMNRRIYGVVRIPTNRRLDAFSNKPDE
ncbi:hypothetical protein BC830DRAFT_1082101 [Chytriomyces sp. MP71]|nr:hypothetical protein BC830DRAFT_1082101 [Chytriomyces sp. MP71]